MEILHTPGGKIENRVVFAQGSIEIDFAFVRVADEVANSPAELGNIFHECGIFRDVDIVISGVSGIIFRAGYPHFWVRGEGKPDLQSLNPLIHINVDPRVLGHMVAVTDILCLLNNSISLFLLCFFVLLCLLGLVDRRAEFKKSFDFRFISLPLQKPVVSEEG